MTFPSNFGFQRWHCRMALAAERGRLNEKATKVSEEQMELSRLQAENAQLRMENEILKKATAYFAKTAL